MKVIYYRPIVAPSKGNWFYVNGATLKNRDEAIRKTKQHVSFRDPETRIARIDEIESDDE